MNYRSKEYNTLHRWVERKLGKPMHCTHCGSTDKNRYAWANKSREYKRDLDDWIRLCYPCHRRYDNVGPVVGMRWDKTKDHNYCAKGTHKMVITNLYVSRQKQGRYLMVRCLECKRSISNVKAKKKT